MTHPPTPKDSLPPVARRRGVVAVIARQAKLLVIQRSRHVRAPLAYCFPGGAIELGEAEPDAVVRELREELGVAVAPIRPLWRALTPWNVDLSWWLAELHEQAVVVPNPLEVEQACWLATHEIRALPGLLESNLQFLDALDAGHFAIDGL
ncbi:MAG: NUDIX domain-containing protein [Planctomycetales bacterium]|nr:NUDIX domain-containing protein [Planctomycetales bacterium]